MSAWNIAGGKASPEILRDMLDAADPDRYRWAEWRAVEWPDAPPLTIPSEGENGLGGLLFGTYGLARQCGWACYHCRDSRGQPIEGFPDWVLIRETVIFVELKRQRDRLNPDQARTARLLIRAGAWYELWRPGDWDRIRDILLTGMRPQ